MTSLFQFAGVGFISTIIDISVLNLLKRAGFKTWVATALGFLAGSTNGYFLNSLFVFHEKYNATRYEKYFIVTFIGLGLTEIIMHILHVRTKLLTLNQAKLVAVGLVFFWNFGMSKLWAFAN